MHRVTAALLLLPVWACSSTATDDAGPSPVGWTTVASMVTARHQHSATALADGRRVLLAGGADADDGELASVEILDLEPSAVLPTAPLTTARREHSATLLADGRVLVAGGLGPDGALSTVEIYEPQTGSWTAGLPLQQARYAHTALALAGGTRVLVVGGFADQTGTALAHCEIYDLTLQTWAAVTPMNHPRARHSATLLADGRVLVTGGRSGVDQLQSMEIYDPQLNLWLPAPDLSGPREGHAAALLGDGQVLVVAGEGTAAVELFDPANNQLTALTGLSAPRSGHTLTPLPDGRLLLVGGLGTASVFDYLADAQLFESSTRSWIPARGLTDARAGHRATLLPDGRVLVSGGRGPSGLRDALELSGAFGGAPGDAGPATDADGPRPGDGTPEAGLADAAVEQG